MAATTQRLTPPTVDSLLDPENRLHLNTDEQLKVLLEKLDVVGSMRTSGGRTKRIRLLRREINALRQKINQQQLNNQSTNGDEEEEGAKEAEEEEQQEEEEKTRKKNKKKEKKTKTKKSTSEAKGASTVSNCGTGENVDEMKSVSRH